MARLPIVFETPRPGALIRVCRSMILLGFLLVAQAGGLARPTPAMADEPAGRTPLEPLDTSSPRATIRSFCEVLDRIYANMSAAEPTTALRAETRHLIQQALTCLDISQIAPTLVDSEGRQALVCLKEVLDRIALPSAADIPDAAAAKADSLKRWRLPGTEIMLSRIADGPREGDFVFSAETVANAERFYELVRLLPYRSDAGSPGLHEAYVTLGGVLVTMSWLCDLLINTQGMRPEAIDSQLIRLGGKVLTFVVVSWILLNAADSIGIPVTPLMAGLGAGGLAVALASQYTLENLIAGLVIFADKPVRIGDDCQFGGVRGHVERIGLRSTRIRGADRSVISVPNAEFAKMQLVNFTARDHIPLALTLTLQPDIAPRPLRKLLDRLHRVLVDHPRLANEPASARLTSASPSAITVEVSAIALTGDDEEHLAIREEVLLTMMEVIRSCGCDTSAEPTASPAVMRAAA